MPHRLTKAQNDDRINKRKIETYQRLIAMLSAEKRAIEEYGPLSLEAMIADEDTAKARRNFNLWQKK